MRRTAARSCPCPAWVHPLVQNVFGNATLANGELKAALLSGPYCLAWHAVCNVYVWMQGRMAVACTVRPPATPLCATSLPCPKSIHLERRLAGKFKFTTA